MDNNQKQPTINMEKNVVFYVIDDVDGTTDKTEERTKEIYAANNNFIDKAVIPELMAKCNVCQCYMPKFMEKNERKRMILNVPPQQYHPELDQEDIDMNEFGIIVMAHDEKYVGISCIVRECAHCHQLNFWGDSAVMSRIVAEFTTNFISESHQHNETMSNDEVPNVNASEIQYEAID